MKKKRYRGVSETCFLFYKIAKMQKNKIGLAFMFVFGYIGVIIHFSRRDILCIKELYHVILTD